MAQSQLLDIVQAASNQANLYTTINDIIEAFEYATQRFLEVDLSASNGQYPMDTEDFVRNVAFRFIDANETNEVFFPSTINGNNTNRVLFVINAGDFAIEFISTDESLTATGTTFTLQAGENAILIIERDNIYGVAGSATLTGADIVALLDAELGSDDWQTGSGGGGDTFWVFQGFVKTVVPTEGCVWSWSAPMNITFRNNFGGSYGRGFNVPNPTPSTWTIIADRAAGNTVIGTFTLTSDGAGGVVAFTDNNPASMSLAAGERLRIISPAALTEQNVKLSLTILADRD